jgi:hypothetical protein
LTPGRHRVAQEGVGSQGLGAEEGAQGVVPRALGQRVQVVIKLHFFTYCSNSHFVKVFGQNFYYAKLKIESNYFS